MRSLIMVPVLVVMLAAMLAASVSAQAVPVNVTTLERNDRIQIAASGYALSPPSSYWCYGVLRATLQVRAPGGWRTIKRIGSHRVNLCRSGDSGWTSGGFTVRFRNTYNLRPRPARICVSATQTVNGRASKHIDCLRFTIHRTRPAGRRGGQGPGL